MPKQRPQFSDLNQVGLHKQYVEWMWRFTDSISCMCMHKTALVLHALTCPLYCVQALPRLARAACARLEPIRLGQVGKSVSYGYIANPHGCVRLRVAFPIDLYVQTIFNLHKHLGIKIIKHFGIQIKEYMER